MAEKLLPDWSEGGTYDTPSNGLTAQRESAERLISTKEPNRGIGDSCVW
jgi:hypothetical protein